MKKFTREGKISYWGPDDPTGEFYVIEFADGTHVHVGLEATDFGGNIYDGIPEIPQDGKVRITIEMIP